MKKIGVVTTTRAEYGQLAPIIMELRKYEKNEYSIELLVSGTHLYEQFGMTISEIENDGIRIDRKIKIPVKTKSGEDISNNQAETLVQFAKIFEQMKYDAVLILGDRYEMIAVAIAALNERIPIFHIAGGDTTEGAVDECIRHSITKMSSYHFVTNEVSRKRVIQLGENPAKVFNFGAPGLDNVLNMELLNKQEALESINMEECHYAVCTYHPVTMENTCIEDMMREFLNAIKSFPDLEFIVTKSNADQGGSEINQILDDAVCTIKNLHVYASLGEKRYLSLLKYCEFVMGNSSSGIIEAPAFHVPSINIGNRQQGRLQAKSTINCNPDKQSIESAIYEAMKSEVKEKCKTIDSPYGDGNAATKIADKCIEICNSKIELKKKFYDVEFEG